MSDFTLLASPETIADFKNAEVTIIYLHNRATRTNTLVFARVCLEEAPQFGKDPAVKPVNLDTQYSIGIKSYDIPLSEAEGIYNTLTARVGNPDVFGNPLITDPNLKRLPRKFTGPDVFNRENSFLLKTENGSHWIEFFNEDKRSVRPVYDPYGGSFLEKAIPAIKEITGINLAKCRDRIGNIVFQFPVTILKAQIHSPDQGQTVAINFNWQTKSGNIPEAYIQSFSKDENSFVDFSTIPCTRQLTQSIPIRSFDANLKIRITRKEPELLLLEWRCDCARITGIIGIARNNPPAIREFYVGTQKHQVELQFQNAAFNPIHYLIHSQIAINRLNSRRSFRQYERNQHDEAISYLRELVEKSTAAEILMIDPYLSANDILKVAYFSPIFRRPIRAIGSSLTPPDSESTNVSIASAPAPSQTVTAAVRKITSESAILNDPRNNNLGLTLEFRIQHGHYGFPMHDRFLLFMTSSDGKTPPMAYSIGTSFNSVGKSYHVISALEGAQEIINDFNEQWRKLNHPECLVWKHGHS